MGKQKESSEEKTNNYLDLEKEKKKTGKVEDLPKSPNHGTSEKE